MRETVKIRRSGGVGERERGEIGESCDMRKLMCERRDHGESDIVSE